MGFCRINNTAIEKWLWQANKRNKSNRNKLLNISIYFGMSSNAITNHEMWTRVTTSSQFQQLICIAWGENNRKAHNEKHTHKIIQNLYRTRFAIEKMPTPNTRETARKWIQYHPLIFFLRRFSYFLAQKNWTK